MSLGEVSNYALLCPGAYVNHTSASQALAGDVVMTTSLHATGGDDRPCVFCTERGKFEVEMSALLHPKTPRRYRN